MNEWIVIVDMDQPGHRVPVAFEASDEFSCETFGTVTEIRELHERHSMGVFMWWAFNFVTGEVEELF